MTFAARLQGVAIALAVLVLCFPVAFMVTMLMAPLRAWFEAVAGIEVYGHSGPAEWCHLLTYAVLVTCCAYLWYRIRKATAQRQ